MRDAMLTVKTPTRLCCAFLVAALASLPGESTQAAKRTCRGDPIAPPATFDDGASAYRPLCTIVFNSSNPAYGGHCKGPCMTGIEPYPLWILPWEDVPIT